MKVQPSGPAISGPIGASLGSTIWVPAVQRRPSIVTSPSGETWFRCVSNCRSNSSQVL